MHQQLGGLEETPQLCGSRACVLRVGWWGGHRCARETGDFGWAGGGLPRLVRRRRGCVAPLARCRSLLCSPPYLPRIS